MAEGWAHALWGPEHHAASAGTRPQGMNPLTIKVMDEVGIDIRGQYSKSVDDLNLADFDTIATVCDNARESCPVIPGKHTIHHSFPDPYEPGQDPNDEAVLDKYRMVRDAIRPWVVSLVERVEG
jgi:arsenate reductase (thioredoxin)